MTQSGGRLAIRYRLERSVRLTPDRILAAGEWQVPVCDCSPMQDGKGAHAKLVDFPSGAIIKPSYPLMSKGKVG